MGWREYFKESVEQVSEWFFPFLRQLFTINYYKVHFLYIIITGFLGSLVIFGIENPRSKISFIDALFMGYSAISQAGLATVEIANLSIATQAILIIMTILGSTILLSLPIPLLRQYYLRKAYQEAEQKRRDSEMKENWAVTNEKFEDNNPQSYQPEEKENENLDNNINRNAEGVGNDSNNNSNNNTPTIKHQRNSQNYSDSDMIDVLPVNIEASPKTKIQDSRFHMAVSENLEYRAIWKLIWLVLFYYLFTLTVSFVLMGVRFTQTSTGKEYLKTNNVNGWWTSFFISTAAINNVGFTNVLNNFVPFSRDAWLILQVFTVVALGNTAFPFCLKLLVWISSKISRDPEPYYQLLDTPRSIYTHLFDGRQTKILAVSWVFMTLSQLFLFLMLDFKNLELQFLTPGQRWLNGLFLSIQTRTGGFNTFDMTILSVGLLVLLTICMYLSTYPYIISLRASAVDGEYTRLLQEEGREKQNRVIVKDIFIQEVFWMYFSILVVCVIEDADWYVLEGLKFSIFKVLFEIVSAYSTVGLSMGYPGYPSFSGGLKPASKLVIIILMLFGRQRGLPSSVDSAVNLAEIAPEESFVRRIGVVPREFLTTNPLSGVMRYRHKDTQREMEERGRTEIPRSDSNFSI
eukprot:TRINITY_DN6709_c0_g1_i2.p1 TRINITY_DN6709_c0_g1~~TRINITY_DN6709_c0_g1_i2.p1  ORF type:complete len:632 (-),score=93.40 TRINITY_DN6709_c0_g1_i2:63-1958(-)